MLELPSLCYLTLHKYISWFCNSINIIWGRFRRQMLYLCSYGFLCTFSIILIDLSLTVILASNNIMCTYVWTLVAFKYYLCSIYGTDNNLTCFPCVIRYESPENMTIMCSTKVCSFGKQVVEKVEVRRVIILIYIILLVFLWIYCISWLFCHSECFMENCTLNKKKHKFKLRIFFYSI